MWIAEVIGYLASVLLAISLLVNNDLKFRWINSMGCIAFVIYGVLIHALPIILTNSILLLINTIYLIRIYRTDENFELLEFGSNNVFVKSFFDHYADDVKKYFPAFDYHNLSTHKEIVAFAVLRNMVIANVFIASTDNERRASVDLNYTVPKYRDFKVGRYLFHNKKEYFLAQGIEEIRYREVPNKDHARFLKIIGFKKSDEPGTTCYLELK
jgi:uncharacterized protein with PQ loop repeat